jgi:hypothetical protein
MGVTAKPTNASVMTGLPATTAKTRRWQGEGQQLTISRGVAFSESSTPFIYSTAPLPLGHCVDGDLNFEFVRIAERGVVGLSWSNADAVDEQRD